MDQSGRGPSKFSPVQSKKILDQDWSNPQFCWTRTGLDWTGVHQFTAGSWVRLYFSSHQPFNGRMISYWYWIYRLNCGEFSQSGYSEVRGYQMCRWVMFRVIFNYGTMSKLLLSELVQAKPVQYKTGSLLPSLVQSSMWTGLDWPESQTGSIWSGGIIDYINWLLTQPMWIASWCLIETLLWIGCGRYGMSAFCSHHLQSNLS